MQKIINFYDIVIIGASFAGLNCAKALGNSNINVLVLEKNNELGLKPCGYGVEDEDIQFIPESSMNFSLKPLVIVTKNKKHRMPTNQSLISSICRPDFLNKLKNELSEFKNIDIKLGQKITNIEKNKLTANGLEINFKYLIGADGSFSIVRKFLGLETKKFIAAVHYTIPKVYPDFEMFVDEQLFDKGYAWIFPNNKFTSVGAAVDYKSPNLPLLTQNLKRWIEKNNIDISKGKFAGSIINYDYQGYKFDNIYLAGDAAGLASGLTGKGMYPACASGYQIAKEILGEKCHLIEDWLKIKDKEEQILELDTNFLELKLQIIEK
ncbi:MAG: NAD(P)/FAD-dependent oxidoreductase [Patescibacteria group bacterium]